MKFTAENAANVPIPGCFAVHVCVFGVFCVRKNGYFARKVGSARKEYTSQKVVNRNQELPKSRRA